MKKTRPDRDCGRDVPSEELWYLCFAPEDAPAANETEQTGCQKDEGTRLRNDTWWRNRDRPLEIGGAALIEIDNLSAVQCEVAGAVEEHRNCD